MVGHLIVKAMGSTCRRSMYSMSAAAFPRCCSDAAEVEFLKGTIPQPRGQPTHGRPLPRGPAGVPKPPLLSANPRVTSVPTPAPRRPGAPQEVRCARGVLVRGGDTRRASPGPGP